MVNGMRPAPVLDVPVAAFVQWLSQVSLDTRAGESPANMYAASYTHPLAMWLSSHVGALCGVYLDQANHLVMDARQRGGSVSLYTLPSWAARFYVHTTYQHGWLTSAMCLGVLKEALHLAA